MQDMCSITLRIDDGLSFMDKSCTTRDKCLTDQRSNRQLCTGFDVSSGKVCNCGLRLCLRTLRLSPAFPNQRRTCLNFHFLFYLILTRSTSLSQLSTCSFCCVGRLCNFFSTVTELQEANSMVSSISITGWKSQWKVWLRKIFLSLRTCLRLYARRSLVSKLSSASSKLQLTVFFSTFS